MPVLWHPEGPIAIINDYISKEMMCCFYDITVSLSRIQPLIISVTSREIWSLSGQVVLWRCLLDGRWGRALIVCGREYWKVGAHGVAGAQLFWPITMAGSCGSTCCMLVSGTEALSPPYILNGEVHSARFYSWDISPSQLWPKPWNTKTSFDCLVTACYWRETKAASLWKCRHVWMCLLDLSPPLLSHASFSFLGSVSALTLFLLGRVLDLRVGCHSMSGHGSEWRRRVSDVSRGCLWKGCAITNLGTDQSSRACLVFSSHVPLVESIKQSQGIPVVAQREQIWLVSMRMQVWSLALLSGLRILCCHELWCRSKTWLGSDVAVAVV